MENMSENTFAIVMVASVTALVFGGIVLHLVSTAIKAMREHKASKRANQIAKAKQVKQGA